MADALGRLRGASRPDFHVLLRRRHRATRRTSPTSTQRFAARHGAGRGFDLALLPIGAYEPRWFMQRAARRSRRGGARSTATSAPSARSASTGARSSSPTSRSTSRRARSPARARAPASPTTRSRCWRSARRAASRRAPGRRGRPREPQAPRSHRQARHVDPEGEGAARARILGALLGRPGELALVT